MNGVWNGEWVVRANEARNRVKVRKKMSKVGQIKNNWESLKYGGITWSHRYKSGQLYNFKLLTVSGGETLLFHALFSKTKIRKLK